MLAPRIAAVSGHVAGLILLAAPSRPLLDILIEQNRRLAVLNDGKIDDTERAAVNAIIEQVRITRDPKAAAASPAVMGQPAGYWRSIEAVDAVSEAQQVKLPVSYTHLDVYKRQRGAFVRIGPMAHAIAKPSPWMPPAGKCC